MIDKLTVSITVTACMMMGIVSIPSAGFAQENMSKDANEILKTMSDYLGGLKKFAVAYDADAEIVVGSGQKLQLSASGNITLERPNGMHITRKGQFISPEFFYDGKKLTLFGKEANAYFEVDSSNGLDQAIDDFRFDTGAAAPGADLLLTNTFETLKDGVISGEYIGMAYIGGVLTYQLAFRKADVDWQLWVRADNKPVPMKYIITTKWVTAAPQYSVRFSNWNTNPEISADAFKFVAPKGAFKVDRVEVDQFGEITLVGEK